MQRSDLVATLLVASGMNRLWRRLRRARGFPVLAYHEVDRETVEIHLEVLKRHYRITTVADACAGIREEPHSPHNRPPLVLTFDDGYASWTRNVVPALSQHGVPAIFFVCPAFLDGETLPWFEVVERYLRLYPGAEVAVGPRRFSCQRVLDQAGERRALFRCLKALPLEEHRDVVRQLETQLPREEKDAMRKRCLSCDDVRRIRGAGFEIGAHSLSHPILSKASLACVEEEIRGSKAWLEALLQEPVRYFAYPNGGRADFGCREVAVVREAGYTAAFSALPGWNGQDVDRFRLRRAVVAPRGSIHRLEIAASGLLGRLEDVWRWRHD